MTFDGQGECIYEQYSGSSSVSSDTLTYVVNEDGTIVGKYSEEDTLGFGVVDDSGDHITFAANSPGIGFGIKLSDDITNTNVADEYTISLFQHYNDADSIPEAVSLLNLTLDDDGTGYYESFIDSRDDLDSGVVAYEILKNGLFEVHLNGDDGQIIHGAFDADANLFTGFQKIHDYSFGIMISVKKPDVQSSVKQTRDRKHAGSYQLIQNYPNPFNQTTQINYFLSESSTISIKLYNLLGREITTLLNDYQSVGSYSFSWQVPNDLTSGVYLLTLESKNHSTLRKIVYQK